MLIIFSLVSILTQASVIQLDAQSFEIFIRQKPYSLVKFVSPHCKYCHEIKPEFNLAESKNVEAIGFGSVDCTSNLNKLLCMAINIVSYPTILLFSTNDLRAQRTQSDLDRDKPLIDIQTYNWKQYRANSLEYRGPRKANLILNWISRQISNSIRHFSDPKQLAIWQDGQEVSTTFFKQACTDESSLQTFKSFIMNTNFNLSVAVTDAWLGMPCTFLLNKNYKTDQDSYIYKGWWSIEALQNFFELNYFAKLQSIDEKNWNVINSYVEISRVVAIVADLEWLQQIKQLQQRFQGKKIFFCFAYGEVVKLLEKELDFTFDNQNHLFIIQAELFGDENQSYELQDEELNLENMSSFVDDFLAGSFTSEEIVTQVGTELLNRDL